MLFICHAGAGGEAASQTAAARITALSKYDMKGEKESKRRQIPFNFGFEVSSSLQRGRVVQLGRSGAVHGVRT